MARRRYVSTEISIDKMVNQLAIDYGDFAALLYTWMIPHAEDNCYINADPYEILNKIIPGRKDKTEDDVRIAVNGMVELGLVELDDKGMRFPPENFYKYQTYIPEKKRTSPQNADNQRTTPTITEEYQETPLTYPSPNLIVPIDTDIDEKLRLISDKTFELGLNGLTNEFIQDAEMRLKEGTEPELIIKALAKAKDKASMRGGVFPYAISILQGWVLQGIWTIEQWNKRYSPKVTDKKVRGDGNAGNKKRDAGGNDQAISGIGIEI